VLSHPYLYCILGYAIRYFLFGCFRKSVTRVSDNYSVFTAHLQKVVWKSKRASFILMEGDGIYFNIKIRGESFFGAFQNVHGKVCSSVKILKVAPD